jgi:hypothetical protein
LKGILSSDKNWVVFFTVLCSVARLAWTGCLFAVENFVILLEVFEKGSIRFEALRSIICVSRILLESFGTIISIRSLSLKSSLKSSCLIKSSPLLNEVLDMNAAVEGLIPRL